MLSAVYVNQTNLNGKLRKKLEGQTGAHQNSGGHGPSRPHLRIATGKKQVWRPYVRT